LVTQHQRGALDHIQLIDFIARTDGFEPQTTWFEGSVRSSSTHHCGAFLTVGVK
jgi:hypothetical protein